MANLERGNHFMSGFGNENFLQEYYMDKGTGLKPGSILSENEHRYKLEIGIPFLDKEDIHLELMGNKLTISGTKSTESVPIDISAREYVGVFYLPEDVKKDKISTHFEEGLLTIILPKMEKKHAVYSIVLN